MPLATAERHFREDIDRAKQLVRHADGLPGGKIKDDILRSSWMICVGASDAYFCDAYADLIARTLRAKDLEPAVALPERLGNLHVPVTAVLREAGGWRWRMAARELIERENVLSVDQIKALFNHFFRKNTKIMNPSTIEPWILHVHSKQRLWGRSKSDYRALPDAAAKAIAREKAVKKFKERMSYIFQRRHDCIHNCDRPKTALQPISKTSATKAIEDIEFLVLRCHEAFLVEYPVYLSGCGFSAATRNAVL